jgi:two-component system sensor histidine kinase KdpD
MIYNNNMKDRPDPDELLKRFNEPLPNQGKLKIFLGYAAGVGKTYAMLEAAHQRKKQGIDVVIGYVETHHREDTEELIEGLELLPRQLINYQNIKLDELNVDLIISRHPGIVLVDELAHSNAPGSRHPKRFLDVEDILAAGIDVYTTLNIQHLESLNDVITQVTGIKVRETVPDRIIDEASEIEVIDLPPDELLTRLREGKVYIPDQAKLAIEKFFRKGNLSALREMSLRRAADRVDDQLRVYMRSRAIQGPWPAAERLLVCVDEGQLSEKLIRSTRRLSDELNAEWFAVHINVSSRPESDPGKQERVSKTLQLAEELGARTRVLTGRSISEEVLAYAQKHNVTKIIIGKPLKPHWKEIIKGSIVEQMIHSSGDIDIFVISSQPEKQAVVLPKSWQPHKPFWRYSLSVLLIIAATLIGRLVQGNLEPANLVMLYLVCVVITAIFLGRGPALLASVLGVLAFDFFLIPPYLTLAVSDTQYIITFLGLFLVSVVISSLTARTKEQADAAIQRESYASAMYSLGRDLTSAIDLHQVVEIIISHVEQAFGKEVLVFLTEGDKLTLYASTSSYLPDPNELAVAAWAFDHDQPAGMGTDTLGGASIRCQPLKTTQGKIGVLGIHPIGSLNISTPEQRQIFNAFANQAALAIERANLAEQAHHAKLHQATEKLQTALLNSISHDLRTPLVSITGALSSLREKSLHLSKADRQNLLETAYSEAMRLNRLVGNLLNMTRLEGGAIHLRCEPCDIQDIIGSALEQLGERLESKPVNILIPPDLPMVSLDFALFCQAVVNLIDNAIKYSPKESPITIKASKTETEIILQVIDEGIGIPAEDLERVFDKFYRVSRPENIHGTGLGLAISKGIIEAHGGVILAENRPVGGTIMTIRMKKDPDQ